MQIIITVVFFLILVAGVAVYSFDRFNSSGTQSATDQPQAAPQNNPTAQPQNTVTPPTQDGASQTAPSRLLSEIEADIFTNETVVKVEFAGGEQQILTMGARDRAAIVAEVASRLSVSTAEVDRLLSLEQEDRASRPDDKEIRGGNGGGDDDSSGRGRGSDD